MATVDPVEGMAAVGAWRANPQGVTRGQLLTAVRYTLGLLEKALPGRAVEVRVPPAGAVQVIGGTTHRRGTPPALVEMSPSTWLRLCVGDMTWQQADSEGLLDASGLRADLSVQFPLLKPPGSGKSAPTR